jgi:predicted anti-sigma-YlaC factor YlaD
MKALFAVALCGLGSFACTGAVIHWTEGALSSTDGTFASDDDPVLVKDAVPFALKAMEALLNRTPENVDLLLALASDFAQYTYAFVQSAADDVASKDIKQAVELRARAARLYLRARAYGQKGLNIRHPGFSALLSTNRDAALALLTPNDVPLAYWTGLAWAAQLSVSRSDLTLLAQLPDAAAMLGRVLTLDETYAQGAAHDFFILYDGGRSEALGGSIARARAHFDRAVELSHGDRLAPFVSWAETVCVGQQDLAGFKEMIGAVLSFDVNSVPSARLANTLSQERARRLLAQIDDLFVEAQ